MTTNPDRADNRAALAALAADAVCVVAFTTLGRRNHDEGVSLAGIAATAWPFLTGTGVGWLLSQGWRRPAAVAPTGVTVWICTVVVGMLLRKATSQGTALTFIAVASAVTAILLLGWRAAFSKSARRHRPG